MKISRIIIIAFVIFVVGSMLFLFVDSKNSKNNDALNERLKSFSLENYSVIVAEDGSDIHVDQSDTNKIDVEYLKDKKIKKQMYKLSKDTLYVYGGLRTFVKCKSLKSIVAHKTDWLGVGKFNLDSLQVDVNGGWLEFNGDDADKTKIKMLTMNISDSARVETYNVEINDFRLNAKGKSDLRIFGYYKKADAKILEKTTLNFGGAPLSLKLEKDESSTINMYR